MDVVSITVVVGNTTMADVDNVAAGAAIATTADNDAVTIAPLSSTEGKSVYIGASAEYEGACVGMSADGTGPLSNDNYIKSEVGEGGGGGGLTLCGMLSTRLSWAR
jgi:hypothetical protein